MPGVAARLRRAYSIPSISAPTTTALAVSTIPRRGTAPSVALIIPEEYSLVIVSTPRTPRASWPRASPTNPVSVGSKEARSAAVMCAQFDGYWLSSRMARPNIPAVRISRIQVVDRRLRSFAHSIRATWEKP